ncbi:DUF4349 domain-containing protein [Solirubrobacter soli]|uniref:DUF4349 domain-containing protein n=1 Tax=Solirubrobacter soli TaxID=363832 RepID=UPI000410FC59|nr:DUF4349 domain-containing protein [Solirubrobacter soli]
MPDLEMLLRDVRPVPNPAWAASLDKRAAAGFPSPPSFPKRVLRGIRNHFAALSLATATVGALFVTVLVISNLDTGSNDDSGATRAAVPAAAPESSKSASGAGSTPDVATAPPLARDSAGGVAGEDRSVLKNASITLTTTVGEVQGLSDRAIRVADTLGGYVASSSVDSSGSHATATLELKVPSAKLDTALAQLSKLGHVSSRSQQTQDLTDQRAVFEAAVRDARADRQGLRNRLAKATTDKQRDRLRAQLNRAGRRVTSAERQVAQLDSTVSYATIDLTIRGKKESGGTAVPGDRWTPGDALKDAGRVLEVIAGVLVIGLAILLPVGILAALAAYANRGLTRRRRNRALEAS